MKLKKWGKMSWGKMSFGEKCRTCANFGKKWGKMSFGEKRRGEKCHGENEAHGSNESQIRVDQFFTLFGFY